MRAKSVIAYFSWMVASSWKKRPSTNFSAPSPSPPLLPLGGRCPQTIAAALGRDDFESGSDSKAVLVRSSSLYPIYRKSSRMATRFAMFLRFENAAGGARRRLLPRLVRALLNREAIQNLCWFVLRMQKRSHFVARLLLCIPVNIEQSATYAPT